MKKEESIVEQGMFEFFIEIFLLSLIGFLAPGPIVLGIFEDFLRGRYQKGIFLLLGMMSVDALAFFGIFFFYNYFESFFENIIILRSLSFLGGAYLLYEAWRSRGRGAQDVEAELNNESLLRSYQRGFLICCLTGSYWLWWTSIGIVYISKSFQFGTIGIWLFIAGLFLPVILSVGSLSWIFQRISETKKQSFWEGFQRLVPLLFFLLGLRLLWDGVMMKRIGL